MIEYTNTWIPKPSKRLYCLCVVWISSVCVVCDKDEVVADADTLRIIGSNRTGDSSDNMHITSGANHAARVHINHARVST